MNALIPPAAIAALAGPASAALLGANTNVTNPGFDNRFSPTAAPFGLSIFVGANSGTGLGSGGLAPTHDDTYTFGVPNTTEPLANAAPFSRDVDVMSTLSQLDPDTFRIQITVATVDGNAFLDPGTALNGFVVDAIGFDLGDFFNGPLEPIQFDDPVIIDDQSIELFAGTQSAGTFPTEGSGTPHPDGGISDFSSQFVASVDPGVDLFNEVAISGATWTIDYTIVPTPGTAAIISFAGVTAFRRR